MIHRPFFIGDFALTRGIDPGGKMNKLHSFIFIMIVLISTVSAQEDNINIANRIDKYLLESIENGFSDTILIAQGGEVILPKGYGVIDTETNAPITSSTVFNIGSVTKQLTAAAIMKLVELGKLSTDDTLLSFFPDVPSDKSNITIHQLLTHSSGISNQAG